MASLVSFGTRKAPESPIRWCSSVKKCTENSAATSLFWCCVTVMILTHKFTAPMPAAELLANTKKCAPKTGKHLKRLLGEHKAYVFSLIQKFNQEVTARQALLRP